MTTADCVQYLRLERHTRALLEYQVRVGGPLAMSLEAPIYAAFAEMATLEKSIFGGSAMDFMACAAKSHVAACIERHMLPHGAAEDSHIFSIASDLDSICAETDRTYALAFA